MSLALDSIDLSVNNSEEDFEISSVADLRNHVDQLPADSALRTEIERVLSNLPDDISMDFLNDPIVQNILQGKWYEMNKDYKTIILPKLERLQHKVTEMRATYPQLVGVSFYGSLAKGYFLDGTSDIDGKIIIYDESMNPALAKEIESALSDFLYSEDMFPGEKDVGVYNYASQPKFKSSDTRMDSIFWSGIFIGDKDKLMEVQKNYYALPTFESTDSLVRTLARRNSDFTKMFERSELLFGRSIKLSADQYAVLKAIIMLKFVPRSFQFAS